MSALGRCEAVPSPGGGISIDLDRDEKYRGPKVRLEDVVRDIQYKPNWTFIARGNRLDIELRTIPSDLNPAYMEPNGMYTVTHPWTCVEWWPSPKACEDFIYRCILSIEMHEAGEFFRTRDGFPYFPHDEIGGRPGQWTPWPEIPPRRPTPYQMERKS